MLNPLRLAERSPLRFFLVVLLLAVALGSVERGFATWRSWHPSIAPEASWIWLDGASKSGEPVAFLAAHDFFLEGPDSYQLTVAADESYSLWLNGWLVGSGAYHGAADRYDLSNLLDGGWNRLVVELRSERGAGGFLASLHRRDEARPVLESDAGWRIFRSSSAALMRGHRELKDLGGEAPKLWQAPPTGRWRLGEHQDRPIFEIAGTEASCPHRLRYPTPGSPWSDLDASCLLPKVGEQAIFDFGEPVEGFLEIALGPEARPALIFFGMDEASVEPRTEKRPDLILLPLDRASLWRDPQKRRFRYLAIYGESPGRRLRVLPAPPAWPLAPPHGIHGVFGLKPAREATRLEEMIWNRLSGRISP